MSILNQLLKSSSAMWPNPIPILKNLTARGGSRALGFLDDFARQQLVTGSRRAGLRARQQSVKGGLVGAIGDIRQAAATPIMRRAGQVYAGGLGITVADRSGLTGKIENALNQVGPGLDRFFGSITPQAIQQFGKDQEKKGLAGVLELATPFGFLVAPFIPNTPGAATQEPPIRNFPAGYRQSELTTGAAAEAFRPGAGFPGQQARPSSGAQQRSQAQETSRVAQLTEQDPLFKKYRIAELTNAYNTASPEDKQRIGLEIWATTNPDLAKKLKPGQTGYQEATSAFTSQTPLGGYQSRTGDIQFSPAQVPPGAVQTDFQVQTPLAGVNVPTMGPIGASERFAEYTPNMQAFTDPMQFMSPPERSQVEKSLIKKAFERRLK